MDDFSKEIFDRLDYAETARLVLGRGLVPLVDRQQGGGELLDSLGNIRRSVSLDLGFPIRPVHIRDSYELDPCGYRIHIHHAVEGEWEVDPLRLLAIRTGCDFGDLPGQHVEEPTFRLDSVWIDPEDREQAMELGYVVISPETVIGSHVGQLLKKNSSDLLGYEETHQILRSLWETCPNLVDALVPGTMSLIQVRDLLRSLLQENISIKFIRTIAETLVAQGQNSSDQRFLVAEVRKTLTKKILQEILGQNVNVVSVMGLDKELEAMLTPLSIDDTMAFAKKEQIDQIRASFDDANDRMEARGLRPILVVKPALRHWLARFLKPLKETVYVFSYDEFNDNHQVKVAETVEV